jgi:hypothetical protein
MEKDHYIFPFNDLLAYVNDSKFYNLNSVGNVVRRMQVVGYNYLTIRSVIGKMKKITIEDNGKISVE